MQQEIASAEKIQTFTNNKMGIMEKLEILSCAAKYDVACTSSGVDMERIWAVVWQREFATVFRQMEGVFLC